MWVFGNAPAMTGGRRGSVTTFSFLKVIQKTKTPK